MIAVMCAGSMRVWVTTVGKKPFAVLNTVWYLVRKGEYVPERVYLIWNDFVEKEKEIAKDLIRILLESYGVSPEIIADESVKVNEDDFHELIRTLAEIRDRELSEGNEIAVDMTPGRKFMSALSMYLGVASELIKKKKNVHRVYYLHLRELRFVDKPLILIPFGVQKCYNMRDEVNACAKN